MRGMAVVVWSLVLTGCATAWGPGIPSTPSRRAIEGPSGDEPRCVRRASRSENLYPLPLAGPVTDPELASWLGEIPADVRRVAQAAGLEPALARLLRDRAGAAPIAEVLARRQAIALHIESMKTQLDAMGFELDCAGDLLEAFQGSIEADESGSEIRWTVMSLVVGAAGTVAAGAWELAGPAGNGPSILGIASGVAATGLGLAAFVHPPRDILLEHERNLLAPVATGEDPDRIYPSFVFRLLTLPSDDGPSPRDVLRSRFDEILSSTVSAGERSRAEALLFGRGGVYDKRLVNVREQMLDELETVVATFSHDVELLQRYMGSVLDAGCLSGEVEQPCAPQR